jgi:hypothetical protein
LTSAKSEELDIDGFHDFLLLSLQSTDDICRIHLSNLADPVFLEMYLKALENPEDDWWKILRISHTMNINHQTPMDIPFSNDYHQKDPTFRMFRDMIMAQI